MTRNHQHRPPDVAVVFGNDPTAPKKARCALQPLLSDPDDPIAEPVELVASELVSNVVEHTPDGGSMKAWDPKPDKPFHLEVTDSTRDEPTSPAEATEKGGRGLRIVEDLADDWGVDHHPGDGKTVWADFNRPNHTTSG